MRTLALLSFLGSIEVDIAIKPLVFEDIQRCLIGSLLDLFKAAVVRPEVKGIIEEALIVGSEDAELKGVVGDVA